MKKLSIVFLLLFALTCTMFAACSEKGGESSATESVNSVVSSQAESSEASSEAESSEASSEAESSEASSEAESSEDENSEDESSEADTSAPASVSNIAKGKKYTITGCGTGFINNGGQWPSVYNANLTDGEAADELSYGVDSKWFAFYYKDDADTSLINAPNKKGSATIDLGKNADLTKVRVHLGNNEGSNIGAPKAITIYTSDNGSSFKKYGSIKINQNDGVYWAEVSKSVSARYVKVEFELDKTVFAFLDEIEVIGA